MKILLLGGEGHLGHELIRSLSPLGTLIVHTRSLCNLLEQTAVHALLDTHMPNVIVNAAAYTQVDKAEFNADIAHQLNADIPHLLAQWCKHHHALLVHYSSDSVFGATSFTRPLQEIDTKSPMNVYAQSKFDGDNAIEHSGLEKYLILRISSVYDTRGRNFLRAIRTKGIRNEEIRVVTDQVINPTWARTIATTTSLMLYAVLRGQSTFGTYHVASPDWCSWYDFASALTSHPIIPITTAEYERPAKQAMWSVLDSSKLEKDFNLVLPSWKVQLGQCLSIDRYTTVHYPDSRPMVPIR